MKRLIAVLLFTCLVLSLAGCGGGSTTTPAGNTGSTEPAKTGEQEVKVNVGGGDAGGGTVTGKIGDNIAWEASKVGGLPKPEGVTVSAGLNMTNISGKAYDFSYIVAGMTKESYEKYCALVLKEFPDIRMNNISDTEGTLIAGKANFKYSVMVIWNLDGETVINYAEAK